MDLPIALRRTRRRASLLPTPPLTPSTPATPSRRHSSALKSTRSSRSAKTPRRVRFSDPGPATPASASASASSSSSAAAAATSTGITPMIRRTSLAYGLDSPAAPVTEVNFLPLRQVIDGRIKRRLRRNGLSEAMNLIYDEQRVAKREKKTQAAAAQLELEQLREEMAAKNRELERLRALQDGAHNSVAAEHDNDNDDRTCDWTTAARDPFASSDLTELMDDDTEVMSGEVDDDDVFGDTTMAELQCSTPCRPQQSRKSRHDEDSQTTVSFGGQSSFPTPPSTSPATAWQPDDVFSPAVSEAPPADAVQAVTAPTTPVTPLLHYFSTATATATARSKKGTTAPPTTAEADVQACLPDPATDALRDEVDALHRETARLNSALETYQTLVGAVEAKIASVPGASPASPLEEQVTLVLRALSDKTAALADLSQRLAALGLDAKGNHKDPNRPCDASEVVVNLASAFRTARLELEYLTPGEIELPLTAPAAQILDLLLGRLRTLSSNAKEADARVDEYREAESSLKEQLAARVSAMDELQSEVRERDGLIAQKNAMLAEKNALLADKESLLATQGEGVAELEVGLERLKGAVASYARDMAELEALVQRLEGELATAKADHAHEADAKQKLEHKLAETVAAHEQCQRDKASLETQVAAAEATAEAERRDKEEALSRRAAATVALNQNHGRALALRDARVHELRGEIEQMNESLREAHETARQLRVDNAGMAAALDAEKQRAQGAVATLQAELTRISQLGKDLLSGGLTTAMMTTATTTPSKKRMTPGRRVSLVKGATVADVEQETRKRRRYDSGLGLVAEDE